jgi:hypothetical protein
LIKFLTDIEDVAKDLVQRRKEFSVVVGKNMKYHKRIQELEALIQRPERDSDEYDSDDHEYDSYAYISERGEGERGSDDLRAQGHGFEPSESERERERERDYLNRHIFTRVCSLNGMSEFWLTIQTEREWVGFVHREPTLTWVTRAKLFRMSRSEAASECVGFGTAVCSPVDEFDLKKGVKLAVKRAIDIYFGPACNLKKRRMIRKVLWRSVFEQLENPTTF